MVLLLAIGGSSGYLLYKWLYLGQGKRLGIKVMLYRSLRPTVEPREYESVDVPVTSSSVTVTSNSTPVNAVNRPVSTSSDRPVSTSSNPTGLRCLVCKGRHINLVQCSQLRKYIPYDGTVTKLPECVCLRCLNTIHSN